MTFEDWLRTTGWDGTTDQTDTQLKNSSNQVDLVVSLVGQELGDVEFESFFERFLSQGGTSKASSP